MDKVKNNKKIIIGLVILIIIIIFIICYFTLFKKDEIVVEDSTKSNIDLLDEYVEGEFNGMLIYESDVKISDEYKINVPSIFSNNSSEEQYSYQYEVGNNKYNLCSVSLSVVRDYTTSNNLISQMHNFYSKENASDINNDNKNGINWNWFKKKDEFGTIYYYATTKNNRVYLLEYEVQSDVDSNCESYREQIINSIKMM